MNQTEERRKEPLEKSHNRLVKASKEPLEKSHNRQVKAGKDMLQRATLPETGNHPFLSPL